MPETSGGCGSPHANSAQLPRLVPPLWRSAPQQPTQTAQPRRDGTTCSAYVARVEHRQQVVAHQVPAPGATLRPSTQIPSSDRTCSAYMARVQRRQQVVIHQVPAPRRIDHAGPSRHPAEELRIQDAPASSRADGVQAQWVKEKNWNRTAAAAAAAEAAAAAAAASGSQRARSCMCCPSEQPQL